MADPATDTSQDGSYGSSFGAMAADASRATKAYADVTREKVHAEGAISGEMQRRGEEDRNRALEAYKKTGVGPEEFKPWNAEIEHKKYESEPLQGFASSGAVFAMIASAFTKAPMLSAIEGMAGALNGIKQGNEDAYTRAFDSYKENIKTAKAKHEIEHQAYTDALSLSTHDLALSNAKLRAEAARFGDKQILALADNGMVKEIYDAIAARNRSMESAASLAENTTIRSMQQYALKTSFAMIDAQKGPPGPDGQPTEMPEAVKAAQKLRQINTVMASGRMGTPQQTAMAQLIMENPTMPVEELLKKAEQHQIIKPAGGGGAKAAEDRIIRERAEEIRAANPNMPLTEAIGQARTEAKPESKTATSIKLRKIQVRADELRQQNPDLPEGEAYAQATSEFSSAGRKSAAEDRIVRERAQEIRAGNPDMPLTEAIGQARTEMKASSKTGAAMREKLIEERAQELRQEDPDLSHSAANAKARREMAIEGSAPSGNQVDKLRGKVDQADNVIIKTEKVLAFLDKYKGGAGLFGKIMRGEEVATNILGISTQSDRSQMRRDVIDIQKMLPGIMADQNGKVLKSDQEKIDAIVAGLNAGDTGPNTKRAMRELLADVKKRKKDFSARITTGFDPEKSSSGAEDGKTVPPASGKAPPANWLDMYPKK